jgi:putative peptide zinc metalloprotease protein
VIRAPKLRDGLIIRKVAEGDDVAYTVCDIPRNQYFRIDAVTRLVAIHLDGTTPLIEVSRICQEQMPFTDISPSVVEESVADLEAIGILDDPYRKNILLLERARTHRPKIAEFFRNMLLWQVGVWDPDRFLDRTHRWVAWLFEPLPALISTIAFFIAAILVYLQRDHLDLDVAHLMGFGGVGGAGVLWFWIIFIVIGFLHESWHAHACKHFGGEVHRMGFMLLYFTPCFFVDVSTSMLFENRWHRIWVAMGGIYIEVIITVLATVVWTVTPTDLLVNDIAYRVMIVGFIVGVLFNLNPLIELDGYYVISDLLNIAELRKRSMAYWKGLLRKIILRKPMREPVRGIRRRRAYLAYGGVAILYTVTIIFVFFAWLHEFLVSTFAETGFLLSLAAIAAFTHKPLGRGFRRLWGNGPPSVRAAILSGLGIALLLVVARFVYTPAHVMAEARIAGARREIVRAREPGRVVSVLVREGDRVHPHQVVALLSNDSLGAAWQRARNQSEESRLALAGAVESRVASDYQGARERHDVALAEEVSIRRAGAGLALSVGEGGLVVTPRLQDWVGSYVEAGDTILVVEGTGDLIIECLIPERDVGLVDPGEQFEARLRMHPGRRLTGRILRVYPVPGTGPYRTRVYRAVGRLDQPAADLVLGATGRVRIDVGRWNIYERVARFFARAVRADFWI